MGSLLSHVKTMVFLSISLSMVVSVIFQNHSRAANTIPGSNALMSVNNVDGQGGNSDSQVYDISNDGNVVLIRSLATNLTSTTGGTAIGIYARNVKAGTTQRVDVSTAGVPANTYGYGGAALSENGRYAVFISRASNLIDGTTTSDPAIYVRDMQAGTTTKVTNSYYAGLSQTWDYIDGISNDGRFVLYESQVGAFWHIPGATRTGYYDVLMIDRSNNSFKLIDAPTTGPAALMNYSSTRAKMSCDGSFVVFQSAASNLTAPTVSGLNIYLADLRNGFNLTSITSGSLSDYPKISCNGDYIVYATQNRTDISPTPTGMSTYNQLVEYNRLTGQRSYISSDSSGQFDGNKTIDNDISNNSIGPDVYRASVADTGDVSMSWGATPPVWGTYYRYQYLKHISDGSGTLENIQKTAAGTYVPITTYAAISANAKYLSYYGDAYVLGLISASSGHTDVIRSSTGL